MGVVTVIAFFLRAFLVPRAVIAAENLALRQQLGVLGRSVKRPRLRKHDRIFWISLSRLWAGWRSCLMIVRPETVIRWHREGFRLYWRWRSRREPGRPTTAAAIRQLIRRMVGKNPTCYFAYYHEVRPHLSLERNAPITRRVEHPSEGRVIATRQVGGLHQRYTRAS